MTEASTLPLTTHRPWRDGSLRIEPSSIPRNQKYVCEAVWETYVELGDNAYRQGFYDVATTMLAAALAEANQPATEEPGLAPVLSHLGRVYLEQQRYKKAEVLYRRALETQERTLPKDDAAVAASLIALAGVFSCQCRFQQATKHLKRALAILRRKFGKRSVETIAALSPLKEIYRKTDQYVHAQRMEAIIQSLA